MSKPNCHQCGLPFYAVMSPGHPRFCSKVCANLYSFKFEERNLITKKDFEGPGRGRPGKSGSDIYESKFAAYADRERIDRVRKNDETEDTKAFLRFQEAYASGVLCEDLRERFGNARFVAYMKNLSPEAKKRAKEARQAVSNRFTGRAPDLFSGHQPGKWWKVKPKPGVIAKLRSQFRQWTNGVCDNEFGWSHF